MQGHANFTENVPITLVLLGCLESTAASSILLHSLGLVFVICRISHATYFINESAHFKYRVYGFASNLAVIAIASISCVVQGVRGLLQ